APKQEEREQRKEGVVRDGRRVRQIVAVAKPEESPPRGQASEQEDFPRPPANRAEPFHAAIMSGSFGPTARTEPPAPRSPQFATFATLATLPSGVRRNGRGRLIVGRAATHVLRGAVVRRRGRAARLANVFPRFLGALCHRLAGLVV